MIHHSMHDLRPPHALTLEPIVRNALEEDFGRAGDLTSAVTVPETARSEALLVGRQAGTIAGMIAAECAFRLVDKDVAIDGLVNDGSAVSANTMLARISGPARSLLAAERVALNFLGHLSGIATATRALVTAVEGSKARIVCTRKTTPGLRVLEKYAVRCGGGFNHRFGLDDAVLIKDNHLAACGGIEPAIARARAHLGHMVKIELEVDTLEQLEKALALGVDAILLDNMSIENLDRAVRMTDGRATLEASGNISLSTVAAVARTGVDYISSGAITHSAASLDVALDFKR